MNLFCCKEDKAKQLESEGVIVRSWGEKYADNKYLAQKYIGKLGYAETLENNISDTSKDNSKDYLEILNLYIMSRSEDASSFDRVGCLMSALKQVRIMIAKGEQPIERLTTFSRIAIDAGEFFLAGKILSTLIIKYRANQNFKINELFLPASQRYESISPKSKINEWIFSSIIEQFIVKLGYSSYFMGGDAILPLFEKLNDLGFISEEMRRRHKLVKSCFLK